MLFFTHKFEIKKTEIVKTHLNGLNYLTLFKYLYKQFMQMYETGT